MSRPLVVGCAAALCWAVAGPVAGQALRATVLGTVIDATGSVLPGATVNVTNTETGVVQSTVADSNGRYGVTNSDAVWGARGHSLKFGAEHERQTTFVDLPLSGDGAWTFPSLVAFLQNQPSLFLGALPGSPNAAIFITTADGGAAYNANAGQITAAGSPRQVQFGAKLVF